MAQAERRRMQHEMAASLSDAAEPAKRLVSAMATAGDAWIEGQAELLTQLDQLSKRWIQAQREAIDATRQSIAALHQSRDLADVLRVQQEWLARSLQRAASDFGALTTMALNYSHPAMMWAGETAQAAGERVRRGEQAILSAAGAKPQSSQTEKAQEGKTE